MFFVTFDFEYNYINYASGVIVKFAIKCFSM